MAGRICGAAISQCGDDWTRYGPGREGVLELINRLPGELLRCINCIHGAEARHHLILFLWRAKIA